jgi:hypothetical protein
MTRSLDLDVDAPDKVAQILRDAAQAYHESAGDLASAWQDRRAGAPWTKIARVLEKAAAAIDKIDMP